ncbi:hypothetical protein VVD49_00720 [Uliginosibacterium sp. H3]|uniref:TonB-dependent receptor n=1 Tax=Uliginosibacterium silvisoli TaxID=3114758 RepID=A0ABU6JXC1_9RHOO|nr:hypothetical protein [Uliginosibacterium sp. H3]
MSRYNILTVAMAAAAFTPSLSFAADNADLELIRGEISALRQSYESRISELEARLKKAETEKAASTAAAPAAAPAPVAGAEGGAPQAPAAQGSGFNPNVSLILSGTYANFSRKPEDYRISGFIPGGEIGPGPRGFSLAESELGFSASVDHLFYGQANFAVSPDNEISVEEAFVQTTALPAGLKLKAGRFFSGIGYLNEQHAHVWDFVDNPLVYQAFLGTQFGQDGVQMKWLAPSDTYFEVGAEAGRGSNFPGSEVSRNGSGAQAVFAHVGGDIGVSHSWRAGVSYLSASPRDRTYEETDVFGNSVTNAFSGSSRLMGADFVWKWSPNGNADRQNFKLQGEYFRRKEAGDLVYDTAAAAQSDRYSSNQSGWYMQGVFQFMPAWRVGLRYDQLSSGTVDYASNAANLADVAYKPTKTSLMFDWSPSEFSRVRLQLARDKSRQVDGVAAPDNQLFLQYQMSLGAHGAHSY